MEAGKILMIGIAGGTGSGKSTLTNSLASTFGDRVTVIRHDDYYRAQHELTYEERARQNYDHPDAFETDRLVRDLQALRRGEAIDCPVYDFTIHDRSPEVRHVEPSEVLILDGILVLADPALREMLDVKIYVDTDADIRILRRIRRDVKKRGRTLDSVMDQYLTTVKPMHDAFVEPSKKYADLIVPEGGRNQVVLVMLENRIRQHLTA